MIMRREGMAMLPTQPGIAWWVGEPAEADADNAIDERALVAADVTIGVRSVRFGGGADDACSTGLATQTRKRVS